ncbi:recombinase family protein [Dyadobacter crusticola]|uniref:recombinase family protein n=1 Tax=Dyadobacter crusticola TaxID=292407 RepID=UPI00068C875C|nr:recombinase family protein [Dyadobacter crusticola]
MHSGYIRFFDSQSTLTLQLSELQEYGCKRVSIETDALATTKYPELESLLMNLSKGDSLVVSSKDQLGTVLDFINLLIRLGQQQIHLICIRERIDTSNEFVIAPAGSN